MSNVVDFHMEREARKPANPHGYIGIYPVEDHGGSWGVFRVTADREGGACLGVRFSFEDALRLARRTATEIGATLDEGVPV